jgi:hypothetical protein
MKLQGGEAMQRHLKLLIWLGIIPILLSACGTTREVRQEDKVRENLKTALAERQVARRRDTVERCRRQGVVLPAKYQQKGGGMLEDYVDGRPPCGILAEERINHAEEDFRATWQEVAGVPVPLGYEWLLSIKRRIAAWLDAGGLTPTEARTVLREAQWVLAGQDGHEPLSRPAESGPLSGEPARLFAGLDAVLDQALVAEGITCRRDGKRYPCF